MPNLEEIGVFNVGLPLFNLLNNVVCFGVLSLAEQTLLSAAGGLKTVKSKALEPNRMMQIVVKISTDG